MASFIPYGDKISHFMFYGFLGFLLNYALFFKELKFNNLNLQIGSLCILVFSIMEEYSQQFFINRTFEFMDILFNITGVLTFSFLHKIKKT